MAPMVFNDALTLLVVLGLIRGYSVRKQSLDWTIYESVD